MYYINNNLVDLKRIFDQNLRTGYIRMDLNENPGGLPENFVSEVLKDIDPLFLSQYPETLAFTEVLASHLGCDNSNICLVNGSSEGIRYIIEAYSGPGGKIMGVVPTYAMYEIYSQMYGRKFVPVHYEDDLTLPSSKIIDAMSEDIQILIICNPNNPIGNAYSVDEMLHILKKAEELEITVLIDEAYHYFYPVSFLDLALKHDNVFVTRTFSKLFSLAGARLGYVVGKPDGIGLIQKLCTPHNVNAISMKFAEAILTNEDMLQTLIDKQLEGKKYIIDKLQSHGYETHAQEGNFIFIKPKTDARRLMDLMKTRKKILIKTYPGIGTMGECLRVTTGQREIMDLFIDALLELDKVE